MSELGERDLSPDGGLRFGIDLLQQQQQQGPWEAPPPLVSAPLSRGASSSPPGKQIQAEEVRPEVKRPDVQVDQSFHICCVQTPRDVCSLSLLCFHAALFLDT